MRAGLDPTLPEALTAFGIETNPADRLPSLAQFSKALDRTLTLPELRAFWRRVNGLPESAARDALITCLYLGGQRPTQLLRVTPRSVDISGATLTLLDPKGRNRHANPRRHVLPIHEDLMPVIRRRLVQTQGVESPLFSTNGRVALRKETVGAVVQAIAKVMAATGELQHGSSPCAISGVPPKHTWQRSGFRATCGRRFSRTDLVAFRLTTTTATTTCQRNVRLWRYGYDGSKARRSRVRAKQPTRRAEPSMQQ